MKHIKTFNEGSYLKNTEDDIQIYNQIIDTIKECFLEFNDEGWEWTTNIEALRADTTLNFDVDNISLYKFPFFKCVLRSRMVPYVQNSTNYPNNQWNKSFKSNSIDISGGIDSVGNIKYENNIDEEDSEEGKDFIVAVKRINQMTGIGFLFSYNNRYAKTIYNNCFSYTSKGRMIINGRV